MPKGEVVPVPILCTVTFGAPIAVAAGRGQARLPRPRARTRWSRCASVRLMGEPARRSASTQQVGLLFVSAVRRAAARHAGRLRPHAARRGRRRSRQRTSASRATCARSGSARCCSGSPGSPGAVGRDAAVRRRLVPRLREFITLTHTRRADHRSLLLAFFVVLPLQYVLVGSALLRPFTVFIPVYVFFAIPVVSALGQRPAALPRAHREDPVGHHGLRLRHEPRAGAAAARPAATTQERGAFLRVLPGGRRRRRADRAGGSRAAGCAAGRWRARSAASFSWRAWALGAGAAALVGALLYWATPFKPIPALVMGFIAGGSRHARRVRDEGAQARRRRAQLGRPAVGDRRGRPARPRRAAVLRGAGVLPLGALVLRSDSLDRQPCASSASTPACAPPASASSTPTAPRLHYVASGTIQHRRGRRSASCRRG